jgi:hypothetical protein
MKKNISLLLTGTILFLCSITYGQSTSASSGNKSNTAQVAGFIPNPNMNQLAQMAGTVPNPNAIQLSQPAGIITLTADSAKAIGIVPLEPRKKPTQ